MREGRFYGLLTLSVALAIWLALTLSQVPKPTPRRFYVLMFAIHALLTTSHLLGIVFSAFFLAVTALLDWQDQRWRPSLYLSGAAAWLLLLLEKQNIVASAHVGKPHFWLPPPGIVAFLSVYGGWSAEIEIVLVLLLCACLWVWMRERGSLGRAFWEAYRRRRPVYVLLAVMLLIPVAFVVEGRFGTPLFAERYLLPVM